MPSEVIQHKKRSLTENLLAQAGRKQLPKVFLYDNGCRLCNPAIIFMLHMMEGLFSVTLSVFGALNANSKWTAFS